MRLNEIDIQMIVVMHNLSLQEADMLRRINNGVNDVNDYILRDAVNTAFKAIKNNSSNQGVAKSHLANFLLKGGRIIKNGRQAYAPAVGITTLTCSLCMCTYMVQMGRGYGVEICPRCLKP